MPYYLYRVDPSGSTRDMPEWPGRIGGPYRSRKQAERQRQLEATDIARGLSVKREEMADDRRNFLKQLVIRRE